MVTASTHAIVLTGIQGHVIRIDAAITCGPVGLAAVGLPDTTFRETRDRVRAAIINSGHAWPDGQITVTVGSAGMTNRGTSLDLGIAIAILAAAGSVPATGLSSMAFIGELGLDGRLRPVPGVLPAAAVAAQAGYATVMVPAGNRAEALLAEGINVVAPDSLKAAIEVLIGAAPLAAVSSPVSGPGLGHGEPGREVPVLAGQPAVRRAAEICAAGGHGVLLRGRPSPATALVATQIQAIMPPLATADAIEVTAIHSLAGSLDPRAPLIRMPPVAAPHHTVSMAAMFGGGSGTVRPGVASLAHRGVLYLDKAPEFDRQVLDALRQPVEHGEVAIHRGGTITRFPARFILVLAAGMCPCDAYRLAGPGEAVCACTPLARRRYFGRLAGPLLDRVDLMVNLLPVISDGALADADPAESGMTVAGRVAVARDRAAHRLRDTPWRVNGEVPGRDLRRLFPVEPGAFTPLQRAVDVGQVSYRRTYRILAVAWTLADLAARDRPGRAQVSSAMDLWLGGGTP